MGSAFAIWTGIGAVGTFIPGIVILGEPAILTRFHLLEFIVAGIIGLKLVPWLRPTMPHNLFKLLTNYNSICC